MGRSLHRAVKLKPSIVFTRTRIESPGKHKLEQTTVEAFSNDVTKLIRFVQGVTSDYLTLDYLVRFRDEIEKARGTGRNLPTNSLMRVLVKPNLPNNKTIFTPSKVTDLIQENVGRLVKAWDGDPEHLPSSPAEIHLSGSNNQYSQITKVTSDDFIIFVMKTLTVEYLVYFHAPKVPETVQED